ncbi:MAG: hypothetical protein ACKVS9_07290 [Phycisphaerae bacterium]
MNAAAGNTGVADLVIRGRCACGKRFRIIHATPGSVVHCPACNRPIPISISDIRGAIGDQSFIPLQDEATQPRMALLIDHGELTMASVGSSIGATGRVVVNHEEALLVSALQGWRYRGEERRSAWRWFSGKRRGLSSILESPIRPVARPFMMDVVASFFFCGAAKNAVNLLLTALACALPAVLIGLVGWRFGFIFAFLLLFTVAYTCAFFWSILMQTALGEDEIPWVSSEYASAGAIIEPAIALLIAGGICGAPAILAAVAIPSGDPARLGAVLVGLALGSLLWPGLMMAIAVGGFTMLLRPDWLIWTIVRIGPAYLVAWLAVLLSIGGGIWISYLAVLVSTQKTGNMTADGVISAGMGLSAFLVLFYFGYVMFRTLGLLYRHFSKRFPWEP